MNKKTSSAIHKLTYIISVSLILLFIWAWIDFQQSLISPIVIGNTVTIEINKGDSFEQITSKLIAEQLTFKPIWFKTLALQKKSLSKLKQGNSN